MYTTGFTEFSGSKKLIYIFDSQNNYLCQKALILAHCHKIFPSENRRVILQEYEVRGLN